MSDYKRSATVQIYAEANKEILIAESGVIDDGMQNPDGTKRTATDAEIIDMAKLKQKMADGEKAEDYYYNIKL